MRRVHLRRYGALDRRLALCEPKPEARRANSEILASASEPQKVRLAGCLRAPPRSWTLLLALAGLLRQAPSLGPLEQLALPGRLGIGVGGDRHEPVALDERPELLVQLAQLAHVVQRIFVRRSLIPCGGELGRLVHLDAELVARHLVGHLIT